MGRRTNIYNYNDSLNYLYIKSNFVELNIFQTSGNFSVERMNKASKLFTVEI